jgi:hypothetical protein
MGCAVNGAPIWVVTQSFNTTTSMGRLTLNVLLSFAQFEREVKLSSSDGSLADIRNLIDRVVISHATIRIHLSKVAGKRRREDSDASVDATITLSQARNHPGRRRCEDLCPPDARQRARHPDRRPPRRASLARPTALRFPPDFGVAGFAGGQDSAFDPDDPVDRFPRAGDRQGGSRRPSATGLWSQASRRPADGLVGSVAHARTPGTRAGVKSKLNPQGPFEIECGVHLANSNLGNGILQPETSTRRAANEPQRRRKGLGRPTAAATSLGNVVLFCGPGNHVNLRGLPGGAEGNRTDGHRGFQPAISRFR